MKVTDRFGRHLENFGYLAILVMHDVYVEGSAHPHDINNGTYAPASGVMDKYPALHERRPMVGMVREFSKIAKLEVCHWIAPGMWKCPAQHLDAPPVELADGRRNVGECSAAGQNKIADLCQVQRNWVAGLRIVPAGEPNRTGQQKRRRGIRPTPGTGNVRWNQVDQRPALRAALRRGTKIVAAMKAQSASYPPPSTPGKHHPCRRRQHPRRQCRQPRRRLHIPQARATHFDFAAA